MLRIVYLSFAWRDFTPADLPRILETARHNNARDGVTGLLVFDKGSFLQILEGAPDPVTACFDRIAQDSRHGGMVVVARKQVDTRLFPDWSMGFANPCATLDEARAFENVHGFEALAAATTRIEAEDRRAGAMLRGVLTSFDAARAS